MAWGFDPYLSSISPYHGAVSAVVSSVAKVVATGGKYEQCWLTFQEYFERTKNDPDRWGQPLSALLGAYKAQIALGCGSIGGKDSMSGTFEEIDVPPTLVSFAVSMSTSDKVVSQEFKKTGSKVILIKPKYDENKLIDFDSLKEVFKKVEALIDEGKVLSCWAVSFGGVSEAIAKMAFGNRIGFKFTDDVSADELYRACYGAFVIELAQDVQTEERVIGVTIEDYLVINNNYNVNLTGLYKQWADKLEPVYPVHVKEPTSKPEKYSFTATDRLSPAIKTAKPRVLIPVFPGTNCEYDSAKAFEAAGAKTITRVFTNLSPLDIRESVNAYAKAIEEAQIIMFPGGFSAGDEPDGSAKFFATAFRNAVIEDAVGDLLNKRDGLILGICNGFQALIKLGLVPNGEITGQKGDSPTLTYNTIGRHISKMAYTKVVTNKSPWLSGAELGGVYTNPASHGEGRFVAPKEWIDKLCANGQVATQYCDLEGNISMDEEWNINGSYAAIEGITSPDGRILGKMAHCERKGNGVNLNIYGEQDLRLFESGVRYFK